MMRFRHKLCCWLVLFGLFLLPLSRPLTPDAAAATRTGSVVAWGANDYGQSTVPAELGDVTAIAAGYTFSLALRSDGTVVGWGNNSSGQITIPPGLLGVVQIAAGLSHGLALKSDGTVVAWGTYFTVGQAYVPPGLTDVVAIGAGWEHSLAVKRDGTIVAWGWNQSGQTDVPPGLTGATAFAGGDYHSLALKRDGTLVAWGGNPLGQTSIPTGLNNVVAITAGDFFSVAVKNDGSVTTWGDNRYGQRNIPAGLTDVANVSAKDRHTLALKRDGTVIAWGEAADNKTAVPAGLSNVIGIAAGGKHSLALVAPAPTGFADVSSTYWATGQIGQLATRGITTGCGTDAQGQRLYCPDNNVTRAEMAAFLIRALGTQTPPTPAAQTFADVPPTYWAYPFIEQFAQLGITTGCGINAQGQRLYCPGDNVTRAEMAAFLVRAKGQGELRTASATFVDVPTGYWAYGWIERFATLGITTGCGDDAQGRRIYCPDRGVTRAEMAVFIIRAYPGP